MASRYRGDLQHEPHIGSRRGAPGIGQRVTSDPLASQRALGRRIRTWRVRRQMSQATLADLTAITQSTLSNYENGKRDLPVSTLLKLAEHLDVDLEDLAGRPMRPRRRGESHPPVSRSA